ncbi:MAG: Cof-type HAD-IIB family hydrolase [Planctomycetota bacterium]|nr:Cof-type HAD-IIB family hydrolase [Planctomycetota bacterium]
MYRLLALDIDGTLLNSRDELTLKTRQAVQAARLSGMHVVLATGRRYSRALPLVEPLGLVLPLVTASGALIKHPDGHRTLHMADFDRKLLKGVLAHLQTAGHEAVLYSDSFAAGFDFHCTSEVTESAELADFLRLNPDCARVHPELMTDPPSGVFAGFAIGGRPAMLQLEAELESLFLGQLYLHVIRSTRYLGYMCEIAPAGATKWAGIQHLAHELGIADHEIVAVGDEVNDIPMVVGAGLGIAMGNAVEPLKLVADRIAPSHDEDGVAEVVRWLLEE